MTAQTAQRRAVQADRRIAGALLRGAAGSRAMAGARAGYQATAAREAAGDREAIGTTPSLPPVELGSARPPVTAPAAPHGGRLPATATVTRWSARTAASRW